MLWNVSMVMARGVKHRAIAWLAARACAQLVGLLITLAASAQDRASAVVDLHWSAPDECPDRAWVLRSIEARLQGASPQPRAAASAHARIEQRDASYWLTLRTDQGERQLNATSCEELAGSAALILAFIVDPQQAETADASPAPAGNISDRPAARLDLSGYARAEWLVDVGMLPHAATGPGVALGLLLSDTSLELSAGFLLNNTVSYVAPGTEGQRSLAQLHAFLAQLGLCQRLLRGPDLGVCVLGEHMRVTADPDETLQSRSTHSAPVWTLFASARAAIPIGTRLAWMLELGVGVPVHGARFRVDGIGVIHETGDVVGRLRTGLGLKF